MTGDIGHEQHTRIVTGILAGKVQPYYHAFSWYSVVCSSIAPDANSKEKEGNSRKNRQMRRWPGLSGSCNTFSSRIHGSHSAAIHPFARSWLRSTAFSYFMSASLFFNDLGNLSQAGIKLGKTQTGGLRGESLFRGGAPAYSA